MDDPSAIEPWLESVRRWLLVESPQSLRLFDMFANEARFAIQWLEPSLKDLRPGAEILEVGAGLGLVSCHLAACGFRVCALEPIGDGFSSFGALQGLVLQFAREQGCCPEVLDCRAEVLASEDRFELAFSVNVMEHVDDVGLALTRIARALRPGGTYRFTCPNYSFPYEPHFDIPTLWSKRLTERVFRRRILHSRQIEDQVGMWQSLNWISVRQVRSAVKADPALTVRFDTTMIARTFERVGADPAFAARRSRWLVVFARWLVASRLHRVLAWIPAGLQPVIDCHLLRGHHSRASSTAGALT